MLIVILDYFASYWPKDTNKMFKSLLFLGSFFATGLFFPFSASAQALNTVEKSNQPWRLCAVYPHLKDSYWLSVNYGMVDEAKLHGVELKVFEAGGYPHFERQSQQLKECKAWQADAILLGSVDQFAYEKKLKQLVKNIPVFATVNKLSTRDPDSYDIIKGQVGVDWYWMGYRTGQFLAARHPKGSGIVNIGWLPGPKSRGGTKPVTKGFKDAIKNSDVRIVSTLWGDNSKELQRNLIQEVLEDKTIAYLVGGAVAIEVAISEVRAQERTEQVKLISTYLSHAVYRGLRRNKVLFSPTDKMVLQGRLSIQQAINYLEGLPAPSLANPVIESLYPAHLPTEIIAQSLSPAEFRPQFSVLAPIK